MSIQCVALFRLQASSIARLHQSAHDETFISGRMKSITDGLVDVVTAFVVPRPSLFS